jgi:AcrR family transcriptional regulator
MRMSASERRDQLLDATSAIVVEHGFQGVTIQSVARRAGITRPIVYEHFGDLQGLLEALVEREMARALEQVSATALPELSSGDPRELMLESLRGYLAAVAAHPETWRLVLMPPEGAPELLRKRIVKGRAAVVQQLVRAVAPLVSGGQVAPDPELTGRLLSTIADEYARLLLTNPRAFRVKRLLAHAEWLLRRLT